MSTRAWRATIRCSRAFSSATAAWATSDAAVRRCSTLKPRPEMVSVPKLWRPALSGSSKVSPRSESVPVWTISPPRPTTMPPVAPVASTTVSTITRRSWSTSCVAASASPRRTVESRMRARSASSSSSRASSWSAISLKAVPEARELVAALDLDTAVEPAAGDRVRGGGEAVERGHDRAADRVGDERDQEQRDEQPDQQPLVRPHDRVVDLFLRRQQRERRIAASFTRGGGERAVAVAVDRERLCATRRRESRAPVEVARPADDAAAVKHDQPVARVEARAAAQTARASSASSGTPETSVPTTLPLSTIATASRARSSAPARAASVGVSRRTPRWPPRACAAAAGLRAEAPAGGHGSRRAPWRARRRRRAAPCRCDHCAQPGLRRTSTRRVSLLRSIECSAQPAAPSGSSETSRKYADELELEAHDSQFRLPG